MGSYNRYSGDLACSYEAISISKDVCSRRYSIYAE